MIFFKRLISVTWLFIAYSCGDPGPNKPHLTTPYILPIPPGFPQPALPSDNELTEESIILGRLLFYDPILSLDSSQSCSSCHNPSFGFTDNGNKYSIESEFADIDSNKSNLIMMKNVTATIYLVNSIPIIIQSKNAHYNNMTYDTKFFNDVVMTHDYHIATSNNLDLEFKKNLITISDNVIYNNLSAAMEADKIEVDLITKNFEIIMNNKKELVKIKSIN